MLSQQQLESLQDLQPTKSYNSVSLSMALSQMAHYYHDSVLLLTRPRRVVHYKENRVHTICALQYVLFLFLVLTA